MALRFVFVLLLVDQRPLGIVADGGYSPVVHQAVELQFILQLVAIHAEGIVVLVLELVQVSIGLLLRVPRRNVHRSLL